jgi:hypothetical protein
MTAPLAADVAALPAVAITTQRSSCDTSFAVKT